MPPPTPPLIMGYNFGYMILLSEVTPLTTCALYPPNLQGYRMFLTLDFHFFNILYLQWIIENVLFDH
jgi:hypothetical protein